MAKGDVVLDARIVPKIEEIAGLGKLDAIGKTVRKLINDAIVGGIDDASKKIRFDTEGLRKALDKATATEKTIIQKLFRHEVSQHRAEERQVQTLANQAARRAAARAEREELRREDVAGAYTSSIRMDRSLPGAHYLLAQDYSVISRRSNRHIVGDAAAGSAWVSGVIERKRASRERKAIIENMPEIKAEMEEAERAAEENRLVSRDVWRQALRAQSVRRFYSQYGFYPTDEQLTAVDAYDTYSNANQAAFEKRAQQEKREEDKRRKKDTEETARIVKDLFPVGLLEQIVENTGLTAASVLTFASTAVGLAAKIYPSIWAQDVSRNVYSSAQAYAQRITTAGSTVGNVLGTVAGAAIGGLATGGMGGQIVGASVGGSIGDAVGGLFGKSRETEVERYLKSKDYALQVRKDALLYGGSGYTLGTAMEGAGVASAGSLNQMRWTGQMLPGAMALGMVSEQDMLMLSLMPEYFAAQMSGADAATTLAAYQKSVSRLPGALRPLVASSAPGGSQDLYSAAMDPLLSMALAYSGTYAGMDTITARTSSGWAARAHQMSLANTEKAFSEYVRDMSELAMSREQDNIYYSQRHGTYTQQMAAALLRPEVRNMHAMNDPRYADFFYGWAGKGLRTYSNLLDENAVENLGYVSRALDGFISNGIRIDLYLDGENIASDTITQEKAKAGTYKLVASF